MSIKLNENYKSILEKGFDIHATYIKPSKIRIELVKNGLKIPETSQVCFRPRLDRYTTENLQAKLRIAKQHTQLDYSLNGLLISAKEIIKSERIKRRKNKSANYN